MGKKLSKSSTLLETEPGKIVEIAFTGEYASATDSFTMEDYATEVVSKHNPSAVLFNFTELQLAEDYLSVDAITNIARPMMKSEEKSFRPACIIAEGSMAKALEWFFSNNMIFGFAGWKLFTDIAEGLAFLKKRLETGTS